MLSSRVFSLIKHPENPVIVLIYYYCIKVYFFEHFEKKSRSLICVA